MKTKTFKVGDRVKWGKRKEVFEVIKWPLRGKSKDQIIKGLDDFEYFASHSELTKVRGRKPGKKDQVIPEIEVPKLRKVEEREYPNKYTFNVIALTILALVAYSWGMSIN